MAEFQTLARPYARAVFGVAVKADALASWAEALKSLASLVQTAEVSQLLGHPAIAKAKLVELFEAAVGDAPAGVDNLIRLLVANGRLAVLPALLAEFERLRQAHESRVEVSIRSAAEINNAQQKAIIAALKQRLDRDVDVEWSVDSDLLGGAVITANDLVIDASVRGKLSRLQTRLIQ